jgi:Bacterial PH domain
VEATDERAVTDSRADGRHSSSPTAGRRGGAHGVQADRLVRDLLKYLSLGLRLPWWRAAWIVLTDRRPLIRGGVLNKGERALPLHFVRDATVHRTWLGVGTVEVSTAGWLRICRDHRHEAGARQGAGGRGDVGGHARSSCPHLPRSERRCGDRCASACPVWTTHRLNVDVLFGQSS